MVSNSLNGFLSKQSNQSTIMLEWENSKTRRNHHEPSPTPRPVFVETEQTPSPPSPSSVNGKIPPKLIVPFPKHFTGRVTYRGSGIFSKLIKPQFDKHSLTDRAKANPFSQLWQAGALSFLSVLFHQLMLHKMIVDAEKDDEMRFYIPQNEMKFSVVEFAVIIGLNFTKGPTDDEKEAMSGSNRLINLYFIPSDNKENYEKKKLKMDVQHECKYTTYGFAPALQYWAYEAIIEVGMMKGLHPRPDEEAYARTITYNGAEVLVEMGVDEAQAGDNTQDPQFFASQAKRVAEHFQSAAISETQPAAIPETQPADKSDVIDRLYRIEEDVKGLYASQTELKDAYTHSHLEVKVGQDLMMEQLRSIITSLQNRPADLAPVPLATEPPAMGGDDEVFPNGYDPYQDDPATPIDACIIYIGDIESQGEILALEAAPPEVEFKRRKRKRPIWFADYMEKKKKQRPSSTFDPLAPSDE
uniref:DUF1985 domain-containing protein n=1 Tax=Cannabis sativa TaxID=3483 RepID=A0A803Q856_CANSA